LQILQSIQSPDGFKVKCLLSSLFANFVRLIESGASKSVNVQDFEAITTGDKKMNVIGAVIAGIVGTLAMTLVMAIAPAMGLPKMDIVGMLGSMFQSDGNRSLGWGIHLMMGILFALVYAALWSVGVGFATLLWGLAFGAVHWLVAGMMMGRVPAMHAGVKAGTVEAPGVFMLNTGGAMAFMGGLVGHLFFGLVVALVYGLFI
jgi:hypothetical protein